MNLSIKRWTFFKGYFLIMSLIMKKQTIIEYTCLYVDIIQRRLYRYIYIIIEKLEIDYNNNEREKIEKKEKQKE